MSCLIDISLYYLYEINIIATFTPVTCSASEISAYTSFRRLLNIMIDLWLAEWDIFNTAPTDFSVCKHCRADGWSLEGLPNT